MNTQRTPYNTEHLERRSLGGSPSAGSILLFSQSTPQERFGLLASNPEEIQTAGTP